MTESEALGFINERIDIIKRVFPEITDYLEVLEISAKALKKQIPKKPTPIDYEKYMDTVKNALFLKGAYWCPNCNHVVKCGTYCSDCGQKLDWGE